LIVVSCPPLSSSLIIVPRPCPRPPLLSVVVVNVRRLCPHPPSLSVFIRLHCCQAFNLQCEEKPPLLLFA
jgi:hypothetical protein